MTGAVRPVSETPEPADMAPLIGHLRTIMSEWAEVDAPYATRTHRDAAAVARAMGLLPKGRGKPEVVLAGDVAVELGAPSTASRAAVLMTKRADHICAGAVHRYGPELDAVARGSKLPFGQVIVVQVSPEVWPDPFALDNGQYLTHRLPGYMARSIPGRLWVRVSKSASARGLSLQSVGAALIATYLELEGVIGVEVVFATRGAFVDSLAPLCLEADVVAGRHRKLVLSEDGDLDCAELSCDECDEQPVCDGLRDMLAQRNKQDRSSNHSGRRES